MIEKFCKLCKQFFEFGKELTDEEKWMIYIFFGIFIVVIVSLFFNSILENRYGHIRHMRHMFIFYV